MGIKSAIVIAQLLDTEGFTDYTANQVERYFRGRGGLTDRQKRQIERLEQAISTWAAELPEEKRLLLGKFVGLHKKMAFDTGLRIGLTCMAVKHNQEYPRGEFDGKCNLDTDGDGNCAKHPNGCPS